MILHTTAVCGLSGSETRTEPLADAVHVHATGVVLADEVFGNGTKSRIEHIVVRRE